MSYGVGDWFRIKNEAAIYVGRLAALSLDRETAIAYIFGPLQDDSSSEQEQISHLSPEQAVLIVRMETLPLDQGHWLIVRIDGGTHSQWESSPAFCSADVHNCYQVKFDEIDLIRETERISISRDACAKLPEADVATRSSILHDLRTAAAG